MRYLCVLDAGSRVVTLSRSTDHFTYERFYVFPIYTTRRNTSNLDAIHSNSEDYELLTPETSEVETISPTPLSARDHHLLTGRDYGDYVSDDSSSSSEIEVNSATINCTSDTPSADRISPGTSITDHHLPVVIITDNLTGVPVQETTISE